MCSPIGKEPQGLFRVWMPDKSVTVSNDRDPKREKKNGNRRRNLRCFCTIFHAETYFGSLNSECRFRALIPKLLPITRDAYKCTDSVDSLWWVFGVGGFSETVPKSSNQHIFRTYLWSQYISHQFFFSFFFLLTRSTPALFIASNTNQTDSPG